MALHERAFQCNGTPYGASFSRPRQSLVMKSQGRWSRARLRGWAWAYSDGSGSRLGLGARLEHGSRAVHLWWLDVDWHPTFSWR